VSAPEGLRPACLTTAFAEGLPVVVMKASAMRRPVISTLAARAGEG
jgi:hypothetical protein